MDASKTFSFLLLGFVSGDKAIGVWFGSTSFSVSYSVRLLWSFVELSLSVISVLSLPSSWHRPGARADWIILFGGGDCIGGESPPSNSFPGSYY